VDDVRAYLDSLSPSQKRAALDYSCPRTGLAAVHKVRKDECERDILDMQ